jgi:hypothetical protein
MKAALVIGALLPTLLVCPTALLAQNPAPAGPPVTFAPVTAVPIPLQSTSGRFSSLNPPNQRLCSSKKDVIGRVVSIRLILVDWRMDCGRGQNSNVLVNIELSNPADAVQMITGRRVVITGTLKSATEHRTARFDADFLIMQKAEVVAGDPRPAPTPAFMSYMICQPPELDALATQLGRELCMQSTLVENLGIAGPALETAARAPAEVSPADAVSGDPNAITCHLDPKRSDVHLPAIACARGSYWVWYKAKWRDPFYPTPAPP